MKYEMNEVVAELGATEKKLKVDKPADVSDDIAKTFIDKPAGNKEKLKDTKELEDKNKKKPYDKSKLKDKEGLQDKNIPEGNVSQENPAVATEEKKGKLGETDKKEKETDSNKEKSDVKEKPDVKEKSVSPTEKTETLKKVEPPKNTPTEIKVGRIDEKKDISPKQQPASTQEEKVAVEKEKKPTNLSKDPAQWVMGSVTGIVGGTAAAVSRFPAKIMDIIADPFQIFTKQFWKDSWFNAKKSLKNTGKTLTSGFRQTDTYETVNTQQSYAKSRGWEATKNDPWYKKLVKRPLWLAGKVVKIPARGIQTALNVVGDTFNGIQKKKRKWNPLKWTWNPAKRTAKDFDYARTKRSWKKLTTRDVKKTKTI